jgi:hypothetical protein
MQKDEIQRQAMSVPMQKDINQRLLGSHPTQKVKIPKQVDMGRTLKAVRALRPLIIVMQAEKAQGLQTEEVPL